MTFTKNHLSAPVTNPLLTSAILFKVIEAFTVFFKQLSVFPISKNYIQLFSADTLEFVKTKNLAILPVKKSPYIPAGLQNVSDFLL